MVKRQRSSSKTLKKLKMRRKTNNRTPKVKKRTRVSRRGRRNLTKVGRNQQHGGDDQNVIDITHLLGTVGDASAFNIPMSETIVLTPKVLVSIDANQEENGDTIRTIKLGVFFYNSLNGEYDPYENQASDFTIENRVLMTQEMEGYLANKYGNYHPLNMLFFPNFEKTDRTLSVPSLGISIEDEFQGLNLARIMIQVAIFMLENTVNNEMLQDITGENLHEQILSIDGDGSGGFWEHMGMFDHRYGYNRDTAHKLKGVGMELITKVCIMRFWAAGDKLKIPNYDESPIFSKIYPPLKQYYLTNSYKSCKPDYKQSLDIDDGRHQSHFEHMIDQVSRMKHKK